MPSTDEITLDDLRITDEMAARIQAAEAAQAKKSKRGRQAKPFVMVPIEEAVAALVALRQPTPLLWLFIVNQMNVHRTRTVTVTSYAVSAWGIGRHAKYRGLKTLEAAGLIRVERQGQRSPVVTVL